MSHHRRPSLPPGARERMFAARDDTGPTSGARLMATLLAAAVFLLIASLSLYQVSKPGPATAVLAAEIASTTEIDLLLAEHLESVRQLAVDERLEVAAIPGYPIGAFLTAEELRDLDTAAVRKRLLEQSAAIVYLRGTDAFDRTGSQDVEALSREGLIQREFGLLTDSTHDRARTFLLVAVVLVGLGACLTFLLAEGPGRFSLLGAGVFFGALAGLLFSGLARLLVDSLGEGDPYLSDVGRLARAIVDVPLRNYAIVTGLGAVIWLIGPALSLQVRRGLRGSGEPGWPRAAHRQPARWDEWGEEPAPEETQPVAKA